MSPHDISGGTVQTARWSSRREHPNPLVSVTRHRNHHTHPADDHADTRDRRRDRQWLAYDAPVRGRRTPPQRFAAGSCLCLGACRDFGDRPVRRDQSRRRCGSVRFQLPAVLDRAGRVDPRPDLGGDRDQPASGAHRLAGMAARTLVGIPCLAGRSRPCTRLGLRCPIRLAAGSRVALRGFRDHCGSLATGHCRDVEAAARRAICRRSGDRRWRHCLDALRAASARMGADGSDGAQSTGRWVMAVATHTSRSAVGVAGPPTSVPRLLAGVRAHHGRMDLSTHLHWYGDPFVPGLDVQGRLTEVVARSGLTGRGGAGFPTSRKLESVAHQRGRTVVVINAMEGEPASAKDRYLLAVAPHLVLDGAAIAAGEVGANAVAVAVRRDCPDAIRSLERALDERRRHRIDRVDPSVHAGPPRYVGGEESALVHWLNGGPIKPLAVPPRPFERGVGGKPTLILNAETAAHLALITRYGSAWFRHVGTHGTPGTALMTIGGAVMTPGVAEVAIGQPLATVIRACRPESEPEMLLVGGYFGGWIPWSSAGQLTMDPGELRAAGAASAPGSSSPPPPAPVCWPKPPGSRHTWRRKAAALRAVFQRYCRRRRRPPIAVFK